MKKLDNTKIDVNSKPFKYYEAKKTQRTKKAAALVAGYTPSQANIPQVIEQSRQYQAIERHFKDELLSKTSISEVSDELMKVIRQDKELGPKLKAIEDAKNWIEPDSNAEDSEQVVIILKS